MTLYLAGVVTVAAMSFSPTVFASGTRVFFPVHFIFVTLAVICVAEILQGVLHDEFND